MARTMNGNLAGRAASIERHDLMASIIHDRYDFHMRFMSAVDQLRELDPDFETWYDNTPAKTNGEMLTLIEARIIELSTIKA